MERLFGTDGIRGPVGQGFFTRNELYRFGAVFASWARRAFDRVNPQILIVSDTRISCAWIKSCIATGILTEHVTIHDAGVLPTPAALSLLRSDSKFDAALVISASHNPYHDNGIKIFVKSGKLTVEEEETFTRIWSSRLQTEFEGPLLPESFGTVECRPEATEFYINQIVAQYKQNFLKGLTIVLDCANGATYRVGPEIFRRLGACVVPLGNTPNGYNINRLCGSLSTQALQEAVIANQAHIGFAFDGDGDRVLAVSGAGMLKDGDDLLAILAEHPDYAETPAIIGTVMTNLACEEYFANLGKKLVRAPVGDRFVAQKIQELGLVIGGEPVGHIILMDGLPSGDGIRAALRTVESIQHTGNWQMKTFNKYPQEHCSIPRLGTIDLNQEPFKGVIESAQTMVQNGRILVRCSGTEPLIRIMVEDPVADNARKVAQYLVKTITALSHNPHSSKGTYDLTETIIHQETI